MEYAHKGLKDSNGYGKEESEKQCNYKELIDLRFYVVRSEMISV
jgi:hypothetical protein